MVKGHDGIHAERKRGDGILLEHQFRGHCTNISTVPVRLHPQKIQVYAYTLLSAMGKPAVPS